MPTKQLSTRIEIKDEAKGKVDLVFSTFNVIDKDGDVTVPGAFTDMDGKDVPVSAYGHMSWEGKLPVGTATIKQMKSEARASAQFFMDTTHGRDTFLTVKALHDKGLGDWSYGYRAEEYSFGEFASQRVRFLQKIGVDEVSPVLVGAGVNTRTLAAKGAKPGDDDKKGGRRVGYTGVIAPHETDTDDGPWVPDEVMKAFGLTTDVIQHRKSFAWHDPASDPERAASYAFLHHDADGKANVRACLIGIAGLNGAKHAPSLEEDDDRKAVYSHLAEHLKDADFPVPELRSGDGALKMNDEALVVLADLSAFVSYAAEVGASRRQKGKTFTKTSAVILEWLDEETKRIRALIDDPNDGVADVFLERILNRVRTDLTES